MIGDINMRRIIMNSLLTNIHKNYQKFFPFSLIFSKTVSSKEALARAEGDNKAKTAFLSMFSHDFRTPMNSIIGMIEISKQEISGGNYDSVMRCLSIIEESADYMLSMLGDILDISKIEKGKLELVAEPFNLNHFIKNISSLMSYNAAKKNIQFVIKKKFSPGIEIVSDKLRLKQILVNLIYNAIKFTGRNGCVLLEILEANRNEHEVTLEFNVSDNGIGMSPEFLDRLFIPFEQERTNNPEISNTGTGLGLPICYNLVKLMNGTIDVKSELNKGSHFTVILTFPYIVSAQEVSHKLTANYEVPKYDFSGRRVLIVDDNAMNLEITKKQLSYVNLQADTALNGEQAICMYLEKPVNYYDLVLMDIQMPIKNGLEAAVEIRCSNRIDSASVKIVAMTANAFPEDIQHTKECGMDGHIAKPVKMSTLYNTLNELLNQ